MTGVVVIDMQVLRAAADYASAGEPFPVLIQGHAVISGIPLGVPAV
jgi:hypothetical protein